LWLYRLLPCLAFTLFMMVVPFTASPEITLGTWAFSAGGLPALALTVYYLREALTHVPRLEITENGFEDRGLGIGFVPWHDVRYLTAWRIKDSGEGIRIALAEEVRTDYRARGPLVRQVANRLQAFFTGTRGLAITTQGYELERDEILAHMRRFHAEAIDPSEGDPFQDDPFEG
jgi:hypothetical protein